MALNLIHETARHLIPEAPHVQPVAMRAIARAMRRLGKLARANEMVTSLSRCG